MDGVRPMSVSDLTSVVSQPLVPYRVERLDSVRLWSTPAAAVTLLDPLYEVAPFTGRAEERQVLLSWLGGLETHSVRALVGPPGSGKTRLAVEVARAWAGSESKALLARHWVDGGRTTRGDDLQIDYLLLGWPTMVVLVEHADHWPRADLIQLIRRCRRGERARFILTARSETFWARLTDALHAEGCSVEPPLTIATIDDVDECRQLTLGAINAFSSHLGVSAESATPYSEGPATPLDLCALALAEVLGLPASSDGPARRLIRNDLAYQPEATLLAVLARDLPAEEADRLLSIAGMAPATDWFADYQLSYPGPFTSGTLVCPYPGGLLGELLSMVVEQQTGQHAQNVLIALVGALAQASESGDMPYEEHLASAVTVLAEGAALHPSVGHWLSSVINEHPRVVTSLRINTIQELCDLDGIEVTLPAMSYAFDVTPGADAACAVVVSQRLVRSCRDHDQRRELAVALSILGSRLGRAGRLDEGVAASKEAVRLCRAMVVTAPESGQHDESVNATQVYFDLLRSLIHLSYVMAPVNASECIEAMGEAVALSRRLSRMDDKFDRMVLNLLHDQATYLQRADQAEAALEALQEAVSLSRALAEDDPDRDQQLWQNLHLRIDVLNTLGRFEQSYADSQEAVVLQERLVRAGHSTGADLAYALSRWGVALTLRDELAPAVTVLRRSAVLYRAARPASPDDRQNLAHTLTMLGRCLTGLGLHEESLAPANEAVALYRGLSQESVRHIPRLIEALNDLGIRYSYTGRMESALSANDSAVRLARLWSDSAGDSSQAIAALGRSLTNLVLRLNGVGDARTALATAQEAVDTLEKLQDMAGGEYDHLASTALTELSSTYLEAGQLPPAVRAARRAVALFDRMPGDGTDEGLSDRARALRTLGTALTMSGAMDDARAYSAQAVEICRELADRAPRRFRSDLANALFALASLVAAEEHWSDAVELGRETANEFRLLAVANPSSFRIPLATALSNLATFLSEAERQDEALSVVQESVAIYREVVTTRPGARRFLGEILVNLSSILSEQGQDAAAIAAAHEAVEVLEAVVGEQPEARPSLARAFRARASRLETSDVVAAVADLEQALTIVAVLAEEDVDAYGEDLQALEEQLDELAAGRDQPVDLRGRGGDMAPTATDPSGPPPEGA